ncbi:MAG: hypothetical protein E6K65_15815 [Nitrospirae bacterium]|nr:MAG: hypothetical protein E6K65_15815 [Nitrospirota bacterium]
MPILQYHSVSPEGRYRSPTIAVHPRSFDRQMAYLARHYQVVPLDQVVTCIAERKPFPSRAVAITFDDGYLDNYAYAFPILKKYGHTATFFITAGPVVRAQRFWVSWVCEAIEGAKNVAGLLRDGAVPGFNGIVATDSQEQVIAEVTTRLNRMGSSARAEALACLATVCATHVPEEPCANGLGIMMGPEHVREMSLGGMSIGSHTVTHPNLPRLTVEELDHELRESKALLEAVTGTSVEHLAYPGGPEVTNPDFSDEVADFVRRAGYRSACNSIRGAVTLNEPLFALRRHDVSDLDGFSGFVFKLERHRLGSLFVSPVHVQQQ